MATSGAARSVAVSGGPLVTDPQPSMPVAVSGKTAEFFSDFPPPASSRCFVTSGSVH
jgi:hypothetical protein